MIDELAAILDKLSQRDQYVDRGNFVFVGESGEALDGSALRRRYAAAQ